MSKKNRLTSSLGKMAKRCIVRGIWVSRFYKGKWQDGKRRYRFKNKLENPAALMRDILKRSGIYDLSNFDKEQSDKVLGQLSLYCDKKVDGFVVEKMLLKEDYDGKTTR